MLRLLLLAMATFCASAGRVVQQDTLQAQEAEAAELKIDTVSELDLQAFLGRWYQMYGSISSTILTFGNAGPQDLCTSADYSLSEDGSTIDVMNQGIRPDGRVTKIWGKAVATEKPGQRKLSFSKFLRGDQTIAPPDFEGDYWVYKLGPKVDDKYAYAIVGGPLSPKLGLDKTQLFVLARHPGDFVEKYDAEVHEWLHENSFSWWWNKPRATGSIGKWRWFPFPSFAAGDHERGDFGQDGCALVKELTPPVDATDPRV